jgi:hypothetical protein
MIGSMFANDAQSRHRPGRALNKPLFEQATRGRDDRDDAVHSGQSIRTQQPRTLVHNVIPAIEIKRLTGDEAGRIMGEEGGGDADVRRMF